MPDRNRSLTYLEGTFQKPQNCRFADTEIQTEQNFFLCAAQVTVLIGRCQAFEDLSTTGRVDFFVLARYVQRSGHDHLKAISR